MTEQKEQVSAKDKKLSMEIIRFIITGLICAALDFLVCYFVNSLFMSFISNEILRTAIYTLFGFIVGVTANYLLSTFWVFKNVENKKSTKTTKFIIIFVILSAVGWLISFATMQLCTLASDAWWHVSINEISLKDMFTLETWSSLAFWLFVIAFGLKTLLGMIWNYLTRKFILYKAPKEVNVNE